VTSVCPGSTVRSVRPGLLAPRIATQCAGTGEALFDAHKTAGGIRGRDYGGAKHDRRCLFSSSMIQEGDLADGAVHDVFTALLRAPTPGRRKPNGLVVSCRDR